MKPVTDPALLAELERKPVSDPAVLAALSGKTSESPTSAGNLVGAAVEPNLSILSGMVAQPVAGLAGLATGAAKMMGMSDADPAAVVRKVSDTLTYQPRTTGGKNAMSVIGAPFEMIGDATHKVGETAADVTGSPAVGAVVSALLGAAPAIGMNGTSTVANTLEGASRGLMRSALKPSVKDVKLGKADRAITTALNEGINVTPGGSAALETRIGNLNDQIAEALQNSPARVDKMAVANRLQGVMDRVEKQADPLSDMGTVQDLWTRFSQHPLVPGRDMPVQLAQEIKQGTYRGLRDKYGELGSADTEAQKALARGLKEEIAAAVPEVAPLNARESDLLNLQNLLDRRVAVAGNKNPLGIAHLSPTAANLVAGLLDRSELMKSMAARGLNPGEVAISDMGGVLSTAPQSFSEDARRRQAVIQALMGAR